MPLVHDQHIGLAITVVQALTRVQIDPSVPLPLVPGGIDADPWNAHLEIPVDLVEHIQRVCGNVDSQVGK